MSESKFILRHQNAFGETHYFRRFDGEYHGQRLIGHVVERPEDAYHFETALKAAEALLAAKNPVQWDILEVSD